MNPENNPCIQTVIWITTKIYVFVHWPIANLPWKFNANPFASCCAKLLTGEQTNKQRQKHSHLGGGNYVKISHPKTRCSCTKMVTLSGRIAVLRT